MRIDPLKKEWQKLRNRIPEIGERHVLCNWVRPEDDPVEPFIDMQAYSKLLTMLPDKIANNLEKARLTRAGRVPMIKAGLGYEELLSAIIADGTAIASSSAEAKLAPSLLIPANYMAPGGIPGRSIRVKSAGRVTTLTTNATQTFRYRIQTTDVITGTAIMASGAIASDSTAQTNTMWEIRGEMNIRTVGSTGTIFGLGHAEYAPGTFTVGNYQLMFMGSAGAATPAAITYDTTAAQFFSFTGQWSLTTAYSITCHQHHLEALN